MAIAVQQMPDADPNDDLDYMIDWGTWLNGDTIDTVDWSVPSGLTSHNPTNSDTLTTIWLTGGNVGNNYRITCKITTVGGREKEDSFYLYIQDN